MKKFEQPIVQQVSRGQARIKEDYWYEWVYRHDKGATSLDRYRMRVPKGFTFNGASIPQLFWTILGVAPFGPMDGPSALHDRGYVLRGKLGNDFQRLTGGVWIPVGKDLTREEMDYIFLWSMQDSGMFKEWRISLCYKVVQKWGKTAWED